MKHIILAFIPGLSLLVGSLFLVGNDVGTDSPSKQQERQLVGSKASSEALVRHFLEALKRGDRKELLDMTLTQAEFEGFVYPALPASQPESNLSAEFLWEQTYLRNLAGLSKTMGHAGKEYELISVQFAKPTKYYQGFVIHPDTRLKVKDSAGEELNLNLFGSIIEIKGEFKLYSFAH